MTRDLSLESSGYSAMNMSLEGFDFLKVITNLIAGGTALVIMVFMPSR